MARADAACPYWHRVYGLGTTLIPLAIPDVSGNEAQYLQECIESTFVSSVGPFVDRFEKSVSDAAGTEAAVAVSSGTSGLHVALVAVGVARDDLVITPSFTFIATANAISHCGAVPWFMDVSQDSWTLDPAVVRNAIEQKTEVRNGALVHVVSGRRISAILPVYTLGMPADMDAITEIAKFYGLPIVADAAAALGAEYKGRALGDLGADLTMISFNGNKTVTAGGGGAVIGAKCEALDLVRHLSTTARVGADYTHDQVGFNYRMTNLQAAVGVAQMERLDQMVGAKRRIRDTYNKAFQNIRALHPFPSPSWANSAAWFSGCLVTTTDTQGLREQLRNAQIDARPFWKPTHLQPPYADSPKSNMDVTDDLWERVLTLPCSTHLTEKDQQRVILEMKSLHNAA